MKNDCSVVFQCSNNNCLFVCVCFSITNDKQN